jgi:hypothetical protein
MPACAIRRRAVEPTVPTERCRCERLALYDERYCRGLPTPDAAAGAGQARARRAVRLCKNVKAWTRRDAAPHAIR